MAADPRRARREIGRLVLDYWHEAIAPFWPQIRALLAADIDSQSRNLAQSGLATALDDLHPRVRWRAASVEVAGACETTLGPPLVSRGLLLIPSAFAWPEVHVLSNAPYTPTIAYAARGVGNLWLSTEVDEAGALAGLLGPTRARVLLMIAVPSGTSELAHSLALAPSTVNAHLKALHAAGLARALRTGRRVLYARTELGSAVASAGGSSPERVQEALNASRQRS